MRDWLSDVIEKQLFKIDVQHDQRRVAHSCAVLSSFYFIHLMDIIAPDTWHQSTSMPSLVDEFISQTQQSTLGKRCPRNLPAKSTKLPEKALKKCQKKPANDYMRSSTTTNIQKSKWRGLLNWFLDRYRKNVGMVTCPSNAPQAVVASAATLLPLFHCLQRSDVT